jgi:hypothetical protein
MWRKDPILCAAELHFRLYSRNDPPLPVVDYLPPVNLGEGFAEIWKDLGIWRLMLQGSKPLDFQVAISGMKKREAEEILQRMICFVFDARYQEAQKLWRDLLGKRFK